mgnify:CR=1 FL=1
MATKLVVHVEADVTKWLSYFAGCPPHGMTDDDLLKVLLDLVGEEEWWLDGAKWELERVEE